MCEVIVLFDGYSTESENNVMNANCSCTLIKGEKNVIVDTMTAWDRERIVEALAKHNIKPDEIHYVVCTHGHADHIGNNNLFTNAEHIVGTCVHRGEVFYKVDIKKAEGYKLFSGVKVIYTPGHTEEDVTVLVETIMDGKPKLVAITGDLFEKEEDILDEKIWANLGNKSLRRIQVEQRRIVINQADFIIPGHGPMFEVNRYMRKLVADQSKKLFY